MTLFVILFIWLVRDGIVFIYRVEIAVQMFNKPPNHKLSIFVDRRGSSLSNFDHRMVTKLMPMQDYYPDSTYNYVNM